MSFVDTETEDYLSNIVSSFSPGIRYACAYGSGVFKQSGHQSTKDNMIDFIFVVNDAFTWHCQTLLSFPGHYSSIRHFGAKTIAKCQTDYGAGVFFNTCVEFNGRMIKYGIIDMKTFINDLTEWKDLYIAGRLHKPVLTLKGLENPDMSDPFLLNLRSAVSTSLFLLPEKFTQDELFLKIASLSYTGDPRMVVGEDKGKVKNIVTPNIDRFLDLYSSVLKEMNGIYIANSIITQDLAPETLYRNFQSLPANLNNQICRYMKLNKQKEDFLKKFQTLSSEQLQEGVTKSVSQIVRRSSTTQTIKNAATAGVRKSLYYSGEKFKKMFRGLIR